MIQKKKIGIVIIANDGYNYVSRRQHYTLVLDLMNRSIFDMELTMWKMNAINAININSRLRFDPDNCDFSIL